MSFRRTLDRKRKAVEMTRAADLDQILAGKQQMFLQFLDGHMPMMYQASLASHAEELKRVASLGEGGAEARAKLGSDIAEMAFTLLDQYMGMRGAYIKQATAPPVKLHEA